MAVFDHNDKSAGPNGSMHLHLNGQEIIASSPGEIDINMDLGLINDNNNWLGRSQWADLLFDGSYDEFRIYDIPLNSADVAANFAAGPDALPEPSVALQLLFASATLVVLGRRAARQQKLRR